MSLKMYVLERDKESGMKFGICNTECYIYFYDTWHKINAKNIDEAKRIYKKACFEHTIYEAKRLNKVLC